MSALMNKYMHRFIIAILLSLILFTLTQPVIAENSDVIIEFFYVEECDHCEEKIPVIYEIEEHYENKISVYKLSVEISTNKQKFFRYGFKTTPGVVVKNESTGNFTIFPYESITFENLKNITDYYLAGNDTIKPPAPTENKTFCFLGFCFDLSKLSLPALTVTLAFLDSFNPCAFFVLILLLNLLIYVRSRRRMLLIGGIFILFSGLIYFLLMAAILNIIMIVEQQFFITIIAGAFALVFGILNIKDFFFFKKGVSLSISEEKKSDLFKRMGKVVRTPFLPALIIGTIVLAIFANTYELLCSLGLPLVYTTELASHNLGSFQYYLFLFFYNVIYVIPLLIILLIFVVKLGGKKLTELQGRMLKLISGIMMFSLGIVLLIMPDLLKNVFAVVGIILLSMLLSFFISFIWEKYILNNSKKQI
jgi:thiol-disulfide isomerase/thioredoxin